MNASTPWHISINNFARDFQPELETRSSPSMLERSHNDANTEEGKEQVESLKLQTYLESENVLGHEQAGFRQYKSTEDQTTHLSQVVEDAFQSKKVTLAVFVDLQRAFDKVWKDGCIEVVSTSKGC